MGSKRNWILHYLEEEISTFFDNEFSIVFRLRKFTLKSSLTSTCCSYIYIIYVCHSVMSNSL